MNYTRTALMTQIKQVIIIIDKEQDIETRIEAKIKLAELQDKLESYEESLVKVLVRNIAR